MQYSANNFRERQSYHILKILHERNYFITVIYMCYIWHTLYTNCWENVAYILTVNFKEVQNLFGTSSQLQHILDSYNYIVPLLIHHPNSLHSCIINFDTNATIRQRIGFRSEYYQYRLFFIVNYKSKLLKLFYNGLYILLVG